MERFAFIFFGILMSAVSILNMRGNINTIHWYNRRRVSLEDAPKYGRTMGLGTLIFGVSILLTGILRIFIHAEAVLYLIAVGGVIGMAFILYAQVKYNKGIF